TVKYFGSSPTVVTRSPLMLESTTPKLFFSLLLLYQLVAQSAVVLPHQNDDNRFKIKCQPLLTSKNGKIKKYVLI
ncbi:MAG: hypothetical protein ACK57R_04890, partial [Dolichospermum sp.]